MALVNQIIKKIHAVNDALQSAKNAEKARVDYLRSTASKLFDEVYQEYLMLQSTSNTNVGSGDVQHPELEISLAEIAFHTEHHKICRQILELFLQQNPQLDQYFCRANILMGLVLDFEASNTTGLESIRRRKLALIQMLRSMDVATAPENSVRYRFLVFNTSVACWKVLRPFIRSNRAKHFVQEMNRISSALEKVDDPDKEWRIMYLSASAVCYEDDKQIKQAGDLIDKAIELAEKLVASSQQKENELLEGIKSAAKESEELLSTIRKLEDDMDTRRNRKKKIDPDAPEEENKLLDQSDISLSDEIIKDCSDEMTKIDEIRHRLGEVQDSKAKADEAYRSILETKTCQQEQLYRLYMQKASSNPADARRFVTSPAVAQSVRSKSLVMLQAMLSGGIDQKDFATIFAQLLKELQGSEPSAAITETQLDVCRAAMQLGMKDVAENCLTTAAAAASSSAILRVKTDLCQALHMVASLDSIEETANTTEGQRLSSRELEGHTISIRIEAIGLLERTLRVCQTRIRDNALLQEICTAVWNASLPLLQPHLRKHVHHALQLVARALETIDAPLALLRAQVHFELAKCEDQADYVGRAKDEASKALSADYGVIIDGNETSTSAPGGSSGAPTRAKTPTAGREKTSRQSSARAPSTTDNDNTAGTTTQLANIIKREDEELDRERPMDHLIRPMIEALSLRGNVYDAPESVEQQVILLLQQIKESSSRQFQRDMLKKAAVAMFDLIAADERTEKEKTSPEPTRSRLSGRDSLLKRMESVKHMSVAMVPMSHLKDIVAPPLEDIETVLNKPRSAFPVAGTAPTTAPVSSTKGSKGLGHTSSTTAASGGSTEGENDTVKYDVFTVARQKRASIMSRIAEISRSQNNFHISQRAAIQVLSNVWNPQDALLSELLSTQIEMHFLLADSLVERLSAMWITQESEEAKEKEELELQLAASASKLHAVAGGGPTKEPLIPDPRALGLKSKYATQEMMDVKRLVIICLTKAMKLATLVGDEVGAQNAVIYFWNMHIHIFRRELYGDCTPEFFEFVRSACDALDALQVLVKAEPAAVKTGKASAKGMKSIDAGNKGASGVLLTQLDDRLRLSLYEAYACLLEHRGQSSAAIEVLTKACFTSPSSDGKQLVNAAYQAKRLCELASRMAVTSSTSTTQPSAGGKGAQTSATSIKFDNPFLNALAALTLAESIVSESKDTLNSAVGACVAIMESEVAKVASSLNWSSLPQDVFDRVLELQAEIWARLTRLRVIQGSTHGAQEMAECCLRIVTDAMTMVSRPSTAATTRESDPPSLDRIDSSRRLSPRVWRWVSVCERYFAVAISKIIQTEGQDATLEEELRLATIRHLVLSCNYAIKAQADDLILAAVASAWNAAIPLMHEGVSTRARASLDPLLRQLLNALPNSDAQDPTAANLRQQIYLYLIEEASRSEVWDDVLALVMEAFDKVSPELQKPLWRWRVIVMSKKGKSVLEGLQKLTAGQKDPSLQATVYAILARASTSPKQQLDAYRRALDIMKADPARVEYLLETSQWQSSNGLAKSTMVSLLSTALDVLYEFEEGNLCVGDNETLDETASRSSKLSSRYSGSLSQRSKQKRSRTSRGSSGNRQGRLSSRGNRGVSFRSTLDAGEVGPKLSIGQCDQAVRICIMLSQLANEEVTRLEHLMEAVYFVERFLEIWTDGLKTTDKIGRYAALTSKEREDLPFYQFNPPPDPVREAQLTIVSEPAILLMWMPSAKFIEVHTSTANSAESKDDVPTKASMQSMALTFMLTLWASAELNTLGYPKHALMLCGWLRALLMFVDVDGKVAALATLHYKALNMITSCGIVDVATRLPQLLGDTTIKAVDYVSSLGHKIINSLVASRAHTTEKNKDQQPAAEMLSASQTGFLHEGHDKLRRPNSFGISTWTQIQDPLTIDEHSCALTLIEDLFDLGQWAVARSIVSSLGVYYSATMDRRGRLLSSIVQARLEMTAGRYRDALAIGLSSNDDLAAVGDAKTITQCVAVMSFCYAMMGQKEEGKRIVSITLDVLEHSCTVSVKLPGQKVDAGQRASTKTLATTALTNSDNHLDGHPPLGSSNYPASVTSSVSAHRTHVDISHSSSELLVLTENSLESVRALLTTYTTFLNFLTTNSMTNELPSLQEKNDPAESVDIALKDLKSKFDVVHRNVIEVAGSQTHLEATLLELTAQARYTLITRAYAAGVPLGSSKPPATSAAANSASPQVRMIARDDDAVADLANSLQSKLGVSGTEKTTNWLVEQLSCCVEEYEKALYIRRELFTRLVPEDKTYKITMPIVVAPAPAPAVGKTAAPKSAKKNDRTPVEPATAPPEPPVEVKSLSTPIQRALARTEMSLALLQYQLAILKEENASGIITPAMRRKLLNTLSPPERYLEETKPEKDLSTKDLVAPLLSQAVHHSSSARDLLASCDVESEAVLLYHTGNLLLSGSSGLLDAFWPGDGDECDLQNDANHADHLSVDSEASKGTSAVSPSQASIAHDQRRRRKSSSKSATAVSQPAEVAVAYAASSGGAARITCPEVVQMQRAALVTAMSSFLSSSNRTLASISSSAQTAMLLGAYALVEGYGMQDGNRAACWLLQLNSIAARRWLMQLWLNAITPSSEVAAAVSRLRLADEALRTQQAEKTKPTSETQKQINAETLFLTVNCVAWRRLDVSLDPSKIINAMPPNVVTVCLQLCPLHRTLYICAGSSYRGAAQAQTTAVGTGYANPGDWIIDKMELKESQRQLIHTLLTQHEDWIGETTKYIARFGDMISQDEDIDGIESQHHDRRIRKSESAIEERLRALLEEMEGLVSQILGEGCRAHSLLMKLSGSAASALQGGLLPLAGSSHALPVPGAIGGFSGNSKTLLLLLDPVLQPLPWEGLSIVKTLFKDKVTRDFSIHLLGHRMNGISASAIPGSSLHTATTASAAGAAPMPSIPTPAVAAMPFGGSAAAPLAISPIAASSVRYMADPFAEDSGVTIHGYERDSIAKVLAALTGKSPTESVTHAPATVPHLGAGVLSGSSMPPSIGLSTSSFSGIPGAAMPPTPAAAGGGRWVKLWDSTGLTGGGVGSLSLQDWLAAAHAGSRTKPSAIVAHLPGRLSNLLNPREALTVNFEHVGLLFCADLAHNDLSFRRQNTADNLKRPEELVLEQPINYAALMSLAGFGSMITMAWSTSLTSQRRFVNAFFDGFTKRHEDVATALASANAPANGITLAGMVMANQGARRMSNSSGRRRSSGGSVGAAAAATGSGAGGADPSQAAAGVNSVHPRQAPTSSKLKRWVRLARLSFGVPSVTYTDNSQQ